jgi:hypothetical protein
MDSVFENVAIPEEMAIADVSVSDFVNLALSRIPSVFGRLALLASLKDEQTGRYGDPLAVLLYGRKQTEDCLRQKHAEIFFAWLRLALVAQTVDLTKCLTCWEDDQNPFTTSWFDERLPEKLIPGPASEMEHALFMGNLRAAFESLKARLVSVENNPDGVRHVAH